jgi:hypothetical protein
VPMRWLLWSVEVFVCSAVLFAQPGPMRSQDDQDSSLAEKSGLFVTEIRAIRMALGISDPAVHRFLSIDPDSLKDNGHILVVETVRGCLQIHVVERANFQEVWSLTDVPNRTYALDHDTRSKGGICPQAPIPPKASGTKDGRIVLEVPVLFDPGQRYIAPYKYTFRWDGKEYKREDGEQ